RLAWLGKARQVLRQAAALHQPHREVVPAGVLAHVVDRHNVRVIQGGDQAGLVAEALDVGRRGELARPDHLERDPPPQALLLGLVDYPHAALAQEAQQRVAAERPGCLSGAVWRRATHGLCRVAGPSFFGCHHCLLREEMRRRLGAYYGRWRWDGKAGWTF